MSQKKAREVPSYSSKVEQLFKENFNNVFFLSKEFNNIFVVFDKSWNNSEYTLPVETQKLQNMKEDVFKQEEISQVVIIPEDGSEPLTFDIPQKDLI